jgi:PAS domain S-box-containing protein
LLETSLLDQLGEGVCQLRLLRDGSGRVFDWEYLYANPAIEALFQGGPLTGQRCSQAFPRLHQENIPLRRFLDETDLAGEARTFECHVLPKGRWLRLSATCVAPGILAIVTHEITERVRMGRALQNHEDRLRVAIASARAGAFDWNTATGECVWSAGTFACFGYAPDEVVPTVETWTSRTHPDDLPQVLGFVSDASRRGDSEFRIEYRVIWPNGSVHWLRSEGRLAYDPGGVVRVVGMNIDITAGKQLELELLNARDDLEKRIKDRTEALSRRTEQLARLSSELILAEQRERERIARVLHDGLQQVLYAAQLIIGTLGSHGEAKVRSVAQEVTTLMDEATRQARTLTAEISPAAVHGGDFNAALRWLCAWAKRAYGLEVAFVTSFSGRVPESHQVLLYQSVRELLFNVARHAQVTQARLDLVCDARGEFPLLKLGVQDEGLGFNPVQAEPAGPTAGSGLGLFSIRERLGQHGGEIEIRSAPGAGTRVSIAMPLPPLPTHPPAGALWVSGPGEGRGGSGPPSVPPRPGTRG